MIGAATKTKALEQLNQKIDDLRRRHQLHKYHNNPIRYLTQDLQQKLWSKQAEICYRLLESPHRVLVKAAHNLGKTWLCAGLVNWFYDTYPEGACITTAPTAREVRDLLWREVRLLRGDRGGFTGLVAPMLYSAPNHYAKGFTAEAGVSFQGRHQEHMLFLFDEAVGVRSVFWETTKSMFQPNGKHFWVAIGNPTDTSSQMYAEELSGKWHLVTMSAVEHPNLVAELAGRPRPFPGAITLQQFELWLLDSSWCDPIDDKDHDATDIRWPPERVCPCCGGTGTVE